MTIPESANKGLENIIACTTEISTIHDTTLLYRGYAIEDLAAHTSFEEVIYLLWTGNLPNSKELQEFRAKLTIEIPDALLKMMESFAQMKTHPMAKLRSAVSLYGMFDPEAEQQSQEAFFEKSLKTTAIMGALVAALSRYTDGLKPIPAQKNVSLAENFLTMIRGKTPTKDEIKLFDTALILHADHELNASAFAARVVISTTTDYYSAITGALGTLKGPLHGGANEQVMLMLAEIGSFAHIDAFIEDAVNAKKKVMGIGHRVYKHGDPRARILKEVSEKICTTPQLKEYRHMLIHIQEQMESRKGLMPNVDFYSGLLYSALDLKPRDFTPIFAVSRIAGWSAQIMEQMRNNRIYRPRGFYTGPTDRKVS